MVSRSALPSSSGATHAACCHVLEDHGMNPHHPKNYCIPLFIHYVPSSYQYPET